MTNLKSFEKELAALKLQCNFRELPQTVPNGHTITVDGQRLLNLSSNDYLGLAADRTLREEFLATLTVGNFLPSASSSRLLTGNFPVYKETESLLSRMFGTEAALIFGSGYHANAGILPAVTDHHTLILADKLVHASLIDGICLSKGKFFRYAHNDYDHLEKLVNKYHKEYERIIIVTESIFSMDGDQADLPHLIALKRRYPHIMLYIDEAHAVGVQGPSGLGCAEEYHCIQDIDFLVGTFGKALASSGAYVVCRNVLRDYLINKMRPFIFTTALPPVNLMWTRFILERLANFTNRRKKLQETSTRIREALSLKGIDTPSTSHIIPLKIGESEKAILKAEEFCRQGFYVLPVRPPTVPEGTSRLRLSLTAGMTEDETDRLLHCINTLLQKT